MGLPKGEVQPAAAVRSAPVRASWQEENDRVRLPYRHTAAAGRDARATAEEQMTGDASCSVVHCRVSAAFNEREAPDGLSRRSSGEGGRHKRYWEPNWDGVEPTTENPKPKTLSPLCVVASLRLRVETHSIQR
jgi:hypothetical protein